MQEHYTKAISLRSIPFRDSQKIITLYTESEGIMTMIVKGLSKKRSDIHSCLDVLSESEIVYYRGQGDLMKCKEASLINSHLHLRSKYAYLQLAMQLAKALLHSQMPGKPSLQLYALLSSFLKQIPAFDHALTTLETSFYLKLLKHEGLLSLHPTCNLCGAEAPFFALGERICKRHSTPSSAFFSPIEWSSLELLSQAPTFSLLKEISIPNEFYEKLTRQLEPLISRNQKVNVK